MLGFWKTSNVFKKELPFIKWLATSAVEYKNNNINCHKKTSREIVIWKNDVASKKDQKRNSYYVLALCGWWSSVGPCKR